MAARNTQFGTRLNLTQTPNRFGLCRPERKVLGQAISVALIASVAPGPLLAQDLALDEIIITATKRAESVMDVPLAITAMTGEYIREINLNDVKDLIAFTPGITGNSKDSFLDFVSVRGIRTIDFGNGGDPSVSLYKNGLYQGRNGSAVSSLYDVERSEVLRGPQGFLFGRNSVSGAINVITTKPDLDEKGGYAELDVGERGVLVFEGAVNVPISDKFALRLSGYSSDEDGYVENIAGGPDLIGHDKQAARLSARYASDKATVDIFMEYEDSEQQGTVYRATGEGPQFQDVQTRINGGVPFEVPSDMRDVNVDNSLGSLDDSDIFHVGMEIDYDLDWATFTSLTGFKDHNYTYGEDYDASPLVIWHYGQDQKGEYFEQEFRLTSDSDGPLSWYAGASYYEEDIDTTFVAWQAEDAYCLGYWYNTCQDMFDYYNYLDADNGDTYYCDYLLSYYFQGCTFTPSRNGLINDRNRISGKYSGYSAYVDLGYEVSDTFDFSVGLRYSYDEKEFSQLVLPDSGGSQLAYKAQTGFSTPNGALVDKQDWDEVTWRLVGNWRPNDSTLFFGSITTGYKPGGFGSFNIESRVGADCELPFGLCIGEPATDRPGDFGPETVTSYEIGYKGTVMDGRTQIGVNAFVYDYEDLQAIFGVGPRTIVDNVGQVDGEGVEIEVNTVLTENVNLHVGMSWFDSEANNVQAFCGEGEFITGDPDACEGNSIPWAPEWTAFAVLSAKFPTAKGEVFSTLAWSWEDDYRGDWPDPSVIYQRIPALNQTDVIVGYRAETWTLSAYVENVFDGIWYDGNYEDAADPGSIFAQHTFGPSRPRTGGVRISYEF